MWKKAIAEAAGYHGGHPVDNFVGVRQARIREREESSRRSFGCQSCRRFEAEDYRTCMYSCIVFALHFFFLCFTCLSTEPDFLLCSEYLGRVQILFEDYPQEACRSSLPEFAGLYFSPLHHIVFSLWCQVWHLVFKCPSTWQSPELWSIL